MDRVTLCRGTPISLQSMFVSPCTHCDSPVRRNGGAMVPGAVQTSGLKRVGGSEHDSRAHPCWFGESNRAQVTRDLVNYRRPTGGASAKLKRMRSL